jgi:hypothetical protein
MIKTGILPVFFYLEPYGLPPWGSFLLSNQINAIKITKAIPRKVQII